MLGRLRDSTAGSWGCNDGLVWTDDNAECMALESAAVRADSLGAGDAAVVSRCTDCDWSAAAMTSDRTSLTTDAVFTDASDAVWISLVSELTLTGKTSKIYELQVKVYVPFNTK